MAKKAFETREGEEILANHISGDCWKMPQLTVSRQVSGKFYFTNQRIAFLATGLIGTKSVSWEIEMKDIDSVKTCMTPPFFPFGILITMKNGDKYKLGVMKRKKYVNLISEHIS